MIVSYNSIIILPARLKFRRAHNHFEFKVNQLFFNQS